MHRHREEHQSETAADTPRLVGATEQPHEPGAEDPAVDPMAGEAGGDPDAERREGVVDLVGAEATRTALVAVHDVLDDLEAETDEGADDQAVEGGSDESGRQGDKQEKAGRLGQFLVDRGRERGRPVEGELV